MGEEVRPKKKKRMVVTVVGPIPEEKERLVSVGQVIIKGSPVRVERPLKRIGEHRFEIVAPEKERHIAMSSIPQFIEGSKIYSYDPKDATPVTDIDYTSGRLTFKGFKDEEAEDLWIRYEYIPDNGIAFITEYSLNDEREKKAIQTVDMKYKVQELGPVEFSGSVTSYVSTETEINVLVEKYKNKEHVVLEFYTRKLLDARVDAIIKNLKFNHEAGDLVKYTFDFEGTQAES